MEMKAYVPFSREIPVNSRSRPGERNRTVPSEDVGRYPVVMQRSVQGAAVRRSPPRQPGEECHLCSEYPEGQDIRPSGLKGIHALLPSTRARHSSFRSASDAISLRTRANQLSISSRYLSRRTPSFVLFPRRGMICCSRSRKR